MGERVTFEQEPLLSTLAGMGPSRARSSNRAAGHLDGWFVWLKEFIQDLEESRTTGRAAEMAFWLFLSLIPLAAVAGLVAAKVAVSNKDMMLLLASLPAESRDFVAKQLRHVAAWNGGSVGAPAALVFVWLGSGGIHAVFDVLEVKAHESRPWWKKRVLAIASCVALSIGTALIAVLAAGLNVVLGLVRGTKPIHELEMAIGMTGIVDTAFRIGVGVLTAIGLVAGLYLVGVPRQARRRTPVLPGAMLAVAMQAALGTGYVFYLSKVGVHSAYQAGLSIIGVTMIALYLFSVALLVGAELNYLLARRKRSLTR
jgi:membrane protein